MRGKPELTYSHAAHLIGCFLLAIYCLLALIMNYDRHSVWMNMTFWPTLFVCLMLFTFFAYEAYAELIWLLENKEDRDHD